MSDEVWWAFEKNQTLKTTSLSMMTKRRPTAMSEKRFSVTDYSKENVPEVLCDGNPMDESDIADLLNEQAETIEVLREWLAAGDINTYRERRIADQKQGHWPADRVELAKRRIAALEGK